MVHHFQRYMSGGSPVPFCYPAIPTQISCNPVTRGLFFHIPPPVMLSIPNLAPIFLIIPHPVFQIWEIPDPENLLRALYQALRGLEFVAEHQTIKVS